MNFKLPTIIEFYGLPEAWNSFQSAKTCTQKTQIAPVWGGAYLSPPPLSLFLGVCETWWLFEDWEEPFQNYWTWLACAKPPYENSFVFLVQKVCMRHGACYWRPWCPWMSLLATVISWVNFISQKFTFHSWKFSIFINKTSSIHTLEIHEFHGCSSMKVGWL
jgi:hypothetical protein